MVGILGDLVLFKVDTNPGGAPSYTILGGQKGATLNRDQDLPETTNKDSKDSSNTYWKEYIAGAKGWSIDADAVALESDTAYQQLNTRYMISGTVKIAWATPGSATRFTGTTYIKTLRDQAPRNDAFVVSVSLQGTGVLVMV